MNNEKDKRILDEIRKDIENISFSSGEKKELLNKIHREIGYKPSPFGIFQPRYSKALAFYFVLFLIFISGGIGVVYASESSLPGDILYPIKTEIVEEIKYVITPDDQKIDYRQSLVDKRITEYQELKNSENVHEKDFDTIENLIIESIKEAFEEVQDQIDDPEQKIEEVNEIISYLETYNNLSDAELEDGEEESLIINETLEDLNESLEDIQDEIVATSTNPIDEIDSISSENEATSTNNSEDLDLNPQID